MKIVYRDENALILRPGEVLVLILFGIIFMGVGVLTIGAMCTEYRLNCARMPNRQIQCRLIRSLFGGTLKEEPIGALLGARLNISSHGNKSDTYQVVLIAADGERRLGVSTNVNYNQQQKFIEAVNIFLQFPNLSNLDVAVGGIGDLWFGMFFFLPGAALFVWGLQARFTTWIFDRMQGTIIYRSETLFGIKTKEYALRDIIEVQIAMSRGRRGGATYRVEMWTRSGTMIPMSLWYSSGRSSKEYAAAVIREFLLLK